jgi:hypothetical protein
MHSLSKVPPRVVGSYAVCKCVCASPLNYYHHGALPSPPPSTLYQGRGWMGTIGTAASNKTGKCVSQRHPFHHVGRWGNLDRRRFQQAVYAGRKKGCRREGGVVLTSTSTSLGSVPCCGSLLCNLKSHWPVCRRRSAIEKLTGRKQREVCRCMCLLLLLRTIEQDGRCSMHGIL